MLQTQESNVLSHTQQHRDTVLRAMSRVAATCVLLIALITLYGLISGRQSIANPFGGSAVLDVETHIALTLLAITQLFLDKQSPLNHMEKWLAAVVSAAVIGIGVTDVDSGILQARINLILAGICILCLTSGKPAINRCSQYIALIIGTGSVIAILANTYELPLLLHYPYFAHLSIVSSLLFYLLSISIFFAQPHHGPASVFISSNIGTRIGKFALLPILLIYPLLGFVTGSGPKYQLDLTIIVLLCNLVLPVFTWLMAFISGKAEIARIKSYELVAANEKLNLELAQSLISESQARGALKEKSQFIANISHEFRTPLSAILGATQLNMAAQQPKEQQQLSQIAHEQAESLLRLVEDVLDLAAVDANKIKFQNSIFPLAPFIETAKDSLVALAASKQLEITTFISAQVPATIDGDAGRLKQILVNLIDNAIKFSNSGEISIAVNTVTKEGQTLLRFSVTDQGIGISQEDQAKIFEPFAQADNSDTRRHGGAGLGLSISKQLVELMGGEIGVDSAIGQGSTFWFTVPLHSLLTLAGSDAKSLPIEPSPITDDHTILIVEDNRVNAKIMSLLLQKLGYKTEIASNGQEALVAVQTRIYSLILMDWQMPVMDGLETTKSIRSIESDWARSVPIVALTAHVLPEDRITCLKAGMNDYLSKPVSMETLQNTLQRWLAPAET